MAAASNAQVQTFLVQRVRPSCEDILNWVLRRQNDMANMSDIYANLTSGSPWTDSISEVCPHVALASDVLAWNTYISNALLVLTGDPSLQLPANQGAFNGLTQAQQAALAAVWYPILSGIAGQLPIIKMLPANQVPAPDPTSAPSD